jgi:hypothetical protein
MLTRILATLFAVSSVLGANTVKDCSAGTSVFKFGEASLLPDPVVPGENSTLSLSCVIPDGVTVDGGTAKYSLTLNGIPFPGTTDDLCTQVQCPLTAGPYSNSSVSVFPAGVSGKIASKIQWYDTSNTLLYCLEVTTRV